MIHDIRNSVSSLSLLSRDVVDNFNDREFQRDALETISAVVTRMKDLLTQLSASSDSMNRCTEDVALQCLVGDVMRSMTDAMGLLTTQLEPVTVRGDANALSKVVENLVNNAVEAVREAGTITVRTYCEDACGVIEVTDTGIGMSEEYIRTMLFVPVRSTKPGGRGIGLHQVREIVQQLGGTISVVSRDDVGTTFWVRLPLAPATRTAQSFTAVDPADAVGTGGR